MLSENVRRAIPGLAAWLIAIGLEVLIGRIAAIIAIAAGVVLLVYYYGGGLLGTVSPLVLELPWTKPKLSRVQKHGIVMSVFYHWEDQREWGTPVITADESREWIRGAWALLDIEVRNTTNHQQRISDLYMEVRRPGIWKSLVGIAEPSAIGPEREWYKRANRRRVEWLLEPHSEGLRQPVTFSADWDKVQWQPVGNDRFVIAIVAELEGGLKTIRLYLEGDILKKKK